MKLTIFTFEFKCLSTKKVIEILTPPTCDLAKICMLFLCVVHVDDCIVPTSSNSNCSQYCHTTQRRIHQWCSPVHRVLRVQVRVLRVWVRVRVLCIRVQVWVLTKGLESESESLKNMDSSPTRVHCRTRVLHHWNACMYQWHVLVIRLFNRGKELNISVTTNRHDDSDIHHDDDDDDDDDEIFPLCSLKLWQLIFNNRSVRS